MSNSTTLKAILIGVDRSMSKTVKEAGRAIDQTSGSFKGLGKVAGVAAAGFGTALAAGVAGIGASVSKAMEYDKTLRMVGATLGTTGAEQKRLGALALKMGADTVFSAADASNAMLELAKGGMKTAQIEGGALAATMTLAAAGGLEMGSAATYVGNALNTFGLKASDAASVAAALAGGANASSASVESLGMALGQVGPGAKTAGVSIQETVGILAAFDNAGIKGTDAGTSLKTMLTRLVPTTKKAAAEMSKLGLDFTDASGKFLPMAKVAEQLKQKLGGLSDEQRTTALATIFGSDATRAATVLMGLGEKGVNKYTKATSDQAAAQKMANTQMEGASGAWEAFKGSVETLAIGIGVKLLPAFTDLMKKITPVVNLIADKAGPIVERFAAWFSNDLWPALKKGYETIMPGVRDALATLTDGLGDGQLSWKKIGEVITQKVIPILALLIREWLPHVAAQIRAIINVVRIAWRYFEIWRDVVLGVAGKIIGGFAGISRGFASLLRGLSHVPGFGWARDAADKLDRAAGKADRLGDAIRGIPSRKNINISVSMPGRIRLPDGSRVNVGQRAGGGPMVKGSSYLVGENGPEFVTAGASSHVTPARQTAALLAGRGAGDGGFGGGAEVQQPVQIVLDGRVLLQALLKIKAGQGNRNLGLA